jgi:hypothetical protein
MRIRSEYGGWVYGRVSWKGWSDAHETYMSALDEAEWMRGGRRVDIQS